MNNHKKDTSRKVQGTPSKSLLRSPGSKSAIDLTLSGKKKEIHFRAELVTDEHLIERPQTPVIIRTAVREGTLLKRDTNFFNDYDIKNQPLRAFIEKENYISVETNVKTMRLEKKDPYVSVMEWQDPAQSKAVSRFSFTLIT